MKYHNQKLLGSGGLISSYILRLHSPRLRSQGRNWSSRHGGTQLTGLLSFLFFICLRTTQEWHCPKWSGPLSKHQSLIKKILCRLTNRPIWERHFLNWNYLFLDGHGLCQGVSPPKNILTRVFDPLSPWHTNTILLNNNFFFFVYSEISH